MYDYLVKEGKKVYAVSLNEEGSVVLDVEDGRTERAPPYKEAEEVTEVGKVRFARVGLYDVLEADNKTISGRVLWFPHFLGPYVLAYDYPEGKLYSVNVESGKAEVLVEEVGSFAPFETNTCCGVEELRFVLMKNGFTYLYSFDRYGKLREIKRVRRKFSKTKDEVAFSCTDRTCWLLGYEGSLLSLRGVFRETVTNAKVVPELEGVVALSEEASTPTSINVTGINKYNVVFLKRGSGVLDTPTVELESDADYELSGASESYFLLNVIPSVEDPRFELYNMVDLLNEEFELEPVSSFGYVSLPDEAVLVGDKVYVLIMGKPEVVEVSS